jgi:tetratricopeptide (TPR) repeat protein
VLGLDPQSAAALASYENFLIASRRYVEARAIVDRLNAVERSQATDTSALTATTERRLGWVEGVAGHVDAAEQHFRASLSRDPQSWVTHWQYGLILAPFRRDEQGVRELEIVRRSVGSTFPYRGHLGAAYALAGVPDTARRIIRELETQATREFVPQDEIALLYFALGDTTSGLKWLDRAIDAHHYWLPFDNGGNPFYIGLRRNQEYMRLMRRINAPGDSSLAIGANR